MDLHFPAALRLHQYLIASHWDGKSLVGPDPGIRFNYRIGRFIKGYLRRLPWRDNYYYLQAQGYWTSSNWSLFARTGDESYREIALRTSQSMLERQREDGAWDYPNPEWRGRVATVEGCWGALGLLESFRRTANPSLLAGALRWHRFLIESVGFQRVGDELAVNYFAYRKGSRVPNNATLVLRFLAELAELSGDKGYLEPATGLLTFLRRSQTPDGELQYAVPGEGDSRGRPHFQCFQYNAFQCLDLMRYREVTGDDASLPLIKGVLEFLRRGLAEDGHAMYQCGVPHRAVTYHAAALGAAFATAGQQGIVGYEDAMDRAYSYVLRMQRQDGSFLYSLRDYGLLSDRRSYPRYLSMILYHLLVRAHGSEGEAVTKEEAREVAL